MKLFKCYLCFLCSLFVLIYAGIVNAAASCGKNCECSAAAALYVYDEDGNKVNHIASILSVESSEKGFKLKFPVLSSMERAEPGFVRVYAAGSGKVKEEFEVGFGWHCNVDCSSEVMTCSSINNFNYSDSLIVIVYDAEKGSKLTMFEQRSEWMTDDDKLCL